MAKKSTKSVKNSDTKILRNYDIYSMEKRVYDMDSAKQRSYDLFSLEKRIYDLEQGGGPTPPTPTPETPTITFMRLSGDVLTGSYTATKDIKFLLVSSSNSWSTYNFTVNDSDITSELTTNALYASSSYTVTYFIMHKDDVFAWNITNGGRMFVATDTNDYEE